MWGRASAGALAGFVLAAALMVLVCGLLPGGWQRALVPGLVAFFPLWTGLFCAGFLFADGRRAWMVLGPAALAAWILLRALQALGRLH